VHQPGHRRPFERVFPPFLQALTGSFDGDATGARLAAFLESARACARTDDDKALLVAGLPDPT
jgi:hypothetical protein